MRVVAYLFIAAPAAAPLLNRRLSELIVGIPMGLGILWWYRRHPGPPEHLASVEHVVPGRDYGGPDAITTPFYMAWCDCGWMGNDHTTEEGARREACAHAEEVREGLHAFGG